MYTLNIDYETIALLNVRLNVDYETIALLNVRLEH